MPVPSECRFTPIGFAHTPFTSIEGMPLQGAGISSETGYVELTPEYEAGLRDLDGFSHCYLIFHLHRSTGSALTVTPFLDKQPHGVFATRSPKRPNPIGLTISRIDRIEGCQLYLTELDLLDGTPILDIKPYLAAFDEVKSERNGWYDRGMDPQNTTSDDRFA